MVYFIYPKDNSTEFLSEIIYKFKQAFGDGSHVVIEVLSEVDSYDATIQRIKELPAASQLVFLGHGHSEKLYGVYEVSEIALVDANNMTVFDDKDLFALACNSAELFKKSYSRSSIRTSIGFGDLPTDTAEIEKKKYIKSGVNEETLERFKKVIVDSVSKAIIEMVSSNKDMGFLYTYLQLLLNKAMVDCIFTSKDRALADLIFLMNEESVFFRS